MTNESNETGKYESKLIRLKSPRWTIRLDGSGLPTAITRNGWDIIHVLPSSRTCECINEFVKMLNRN